MTEKRSGDPTSGRQEDDDRKTAARKVGAARFVPMAAGFQTAVVVPGALGSGPPQPEPEERWTLAPGRHDRPTPDADEDVEAAPRGPWPDGPPADPPPLDTAD
jgi:hypothetical protein